MFLKPLLVLKLIQTIGNEQPFVVEFVKKDGSKRKMLCVIDSERAPVMAKADHPTVVSVWDREKEAIRAFKIDRVVRISVP